MASISSYQAEDVWLRLVQPVQKALVISRTNAIHIPGVKGEHTQIAQKRSLVSLQR
jgi:hypothetical protein